MKKLIFPSSYQPPKQNSRSCQSFYSSHHTVTLLLFSLEYWLVFMLIRELFLSQFSKTNSLIFDFHFSSICLMPFKKGWSGRGNPKLFSIMSF